jgi:hypothetical protein
MRNKVSTTVLALADRNLQSSCPYQALQNGGMDWSVTRCHSCGSFEFDCVRQPRISRVPIVPKSAILGQGLKRSSTAARQLPYVVSSDGLGRLRSSYPWSPS